MRRRRAAAAVFAVLVGFPARDAVQATEDVVDIRVVFPVHLANEARVKTCLPTPGNYEVHGSLVAPASVLQAPSPAVTLYLHGSSLGEFAWRLPVPGYDFAVEMARLGQASVAIDQLGYDRSGHPDGNALCVGALATVAHEVVQHLRNGTYVVQGLPAVPKFTRVAIAGHSMGGHVAEVEAYSFQDVDALLAMGTGHLTVPLILTGLTDFLRSCAAGGGPPETAEPVLGYEYLWPSAEAELDDVFFDASKDVREAIAARINKDTCGVQNSIGGHVFLWDAPYLSEIDVPVLLIFGERDAVFTPQPLVGQIEIARFTGAWDKTLIIHAGESHSGMLAGTAARFREEIAHWLHARGI